MLPGLFVDSAGNLSDGPFADAPFPFQDAQSGFQGAAGIEVDQPDGGTRTYLLGKDFSQYATFESRPDPAEVSSPCRRSWSGAVETAVTSVARVPPTGIALRLERTPGGIPTKAKNPPDVSVAASTMLVVVAPGKARRTGAVVDEGGDGDGGTASGGRAVTS